MTSEIVILIASGTTLLAVALAVLLVLQWRAGRHAGIFRERLLDLARRLDETAAREERLSTLLAEGQAKNLETIQSRFAGAVDTLNRQLGTVTSSLNDQLSQTRGNIGRQLEGTQKVVSHVQERLGELTATAKNMHDLGRDIARLQDILQAPKLRGNLGELFLEELLSQVLPPGSFGMQHTFSTGERVDAVIRLGDRLVPVDSKFPLESFNRILSSDSDDAKKKARREFISSVKKRIDEISGKYIRTSEGTYDFALMYIPAENVFYESIVRDGDAGDGKSIFNHALEKHVVPVSPGSFYAYLLAVAYGLRGLQIEKRAEEIWGELSRLRTGLEQFGEDFQVLGRHLDNARGRYADADRKLGGLHETLRHISGDDENLPPESGR